MNYIGSKKSLLRFLRESIGKHWKQKPGTFCDAFAGTGVVGEDFKAHGWQVVSGDIQEYSVVRLRHIFLNNSEPDFTKLLKFLKLNISEKEIPGQVVCDYLNTIPGKKGFVYKNYSPGGTRNQEYQRNYFTDENAMRCDAIRDLLDEWQTKNLLSEAEFSYLLAALLEAIDMRANTASVYGAFLKKIKASAAKPIELKPLPITTSSRQHKVYKTDANDLVSQTSGDVLYLDPPYNQRQYAANYHLLETIALNDHPTIKGKTGLRDWSVQKSPWCSKASVAKTFEELIASADYKIIALSYNDEGLMSLKEIKEIMSRYGKYTLHEKKYSRFRADKAAARNHKKDYVYEYLHILEKPISE